MDILLNNVTLPLYQQTYPYLLTTLPHLHRLYTTTTSTLHPLLLSLHTTLSPLLLPLFTSISTLASSAPAAFTLVLLLLLIFLVIKIMNWIRRLLAWGLKMMFGLFFWGVIGVLVLKVLERGVGRTGEDVAGWVREVGGVWWVEYQKALREKEGGGGSVEGWR